MSEIISPPPTHLIFSLSVHVPLRKLAMVLTGIKPKIIVLVATVTGNEWFHGFITSNNNIPSSIKIIFVVIKTDLSQQQPLK